MSTGDVSWQCAFFLLDFITCWCCIELGRSSFVSSVRFGGVYLHLRVSCVSLLPPAACSNSSSSGGADVTRSTHTFGRVSRQPEQLRTAREMCDPCAEVARDTCLNKKGTFPFHRFGSRVSLALCVWIRGDFYCGSWLTGHQYETSFPVPAEPKGETHSTKGMTWVTRHFVAFKPPCLVQFEWWIKHIYFLHYTATFCQPLKASKVNVL